jgi:hypothetical protein
VVLTEVVVPAEPAAVTSIDVHGNVGEVELLEGVGDAFAVAGGRVLAGLFVGVGDEVGEGVGFDDEGDGGVGVLFEDGDDGWGLLAWSSVECSYFCTYGQCTRSCRWKCHRQQVHRWRPSRRSHDRGDRR